MSQIDPLLKVLRSQLFEDARLHLDDLRSYLLIFPSEPGPALNQVMRTLHSLKGDLQAVGFNFCGQFVHEFEDRVLQLTKRFETVGPEESELLVFESIMAHVVSSFESYLNSLRETGMDHEDQRAKARLSLQALETGELPVSAEAASPPSSRVEVAPVETAPAPIVPEEVKRSPLPRVEVTQGLYLLCRHDDLSLAVPIRQVTEIVESQSWNPIPYPRPDLLGLLNLRGEILPILNLSTVTGAVTSDTGYIVVCNTGRGLFGFPVAEAEQIVELDSQGFQDVSQVRASPVVTHFFRWRERTVLVLDIERALAS